MGKVTERCGHHGLPVPSPSAASAPLDGSTTRSASDLGRSHLDDDPALDWMGRALDLAARGRCGTWPNPMVGAVVLDAEGSLVGEGSHTAFGGPHAEVVALEHAGERARGGTLIVTLEPCAHHGKTPPCVEAILAAGVQRVVMAMRDPNPTSAGGMDRLEAEGVDVSLAGDHERARALNRRWLKWVQERQPWITLKAAVSLDGRIATRTGESRWITGDQARHRSLELREEHDAILVGVGTILADDPRLTRRLGINPSEGWRRIVLDSRLRTPSEARVVAEDPELTLIAHTAEATPADRGRLEAAGVQLIEVPSDSSGRVEVHHLLERLTRLGVAALLVEGGAAVHGSFVDGDLVDEAVFLIAPILIGGPAPAAVAGHGFADLDLVPRYRFEEVGRHGDDLELRAVRRGQSDVHGSD